MKITKNLLIIEHIYKEKSINQISKELSIPRTSLGRIFGKYHIKIIRRYDGKYNPNFKHGETLKKHYCNCGNEIGYKTFKYGKGRCKSCNAKYLHKIKKIKVPDITGKNNPNFKEKIKVNCSYCNKLLERIPYRIKIYKNSFCNKEHFYLWKKENTIGNKNSNWIDGRSFEPYSSEFTEQLRESIRKRDNFTCQLCGKTQEREINDIKRKLPIHHIDYDKKNCKEINLITLCQKDNGRVNKDRQKWINYFKKIIKQILRRK